ncbi:MAG: hypothetical protein MZV70_11865 [Desulfobacterales bacterium]|nr:hypothetical protein [Desulfobacterales bacterium]
MRQKVRNSSGTTTTSGLIIREFAELDKDVDVAALRGDATTRKPSSPPWLSAGRRLVAALRTKNLYPPGMYAGKIAETVVELYGAKGKAAEEIVFDDMEFLAREHEAAQAAIKYEAETPDIERAAGRGAWTRRSSKRAKRSRSSTRP